MCQILTASTIKTFHLYQYRTMDLTWVLVGLVLVVVGFFAYQWFNLASTKKVKTRTPGLRPSPPPSQGQDMDATPAAVPYPEVAGQSEEDLRQKEPLQRPSPPSNQQPVTSDGKAPADFKENLRKPEQSFHEVAPTLKVSDVTGRTVETNGSGFNPEIAQNSGPLEGNIFAFDGMEPTGFATF